MMSWWNSLPIFGTELEKKFKISKIHVRKSGRCCHTQQ